MAYRLGSRNWTGEEHDWQSELGRAHQARVRPRCMCTAQGQEVYVALVSGHYSLKRMPGSGAAHASSCLHFELPLSVSGEGMVLGDAIVEDEQGTVVLKLDFPLQKFSGRAPPAPKEGGLEHARADGSRLSIRALLHYLWKEAGLHQWSPAMQGKRSYGTFFKYVQRAAANKEVGGVALGDVLAVPSPGEVEERGRHSQGSDVQLRLARATAIPGGGKRLGLLLGEVYEIEPGSLFGRIKLKCMLDRPVSVPSDLYARMVKHFGTQLGLWQPGRDRLVMLASFFCDLSGVPVVQELALMNLTAEWIPFESVYEQELFAALIQEGRRFSKSLRFNVPSTLPMASAVLNDAGDPAVALFIEIPSDAPGDLEKQIASAEGQGLRVWQWRPGEDSLASTPLPAHAVL